MGFQSETLGAPRLSREPVVMALGHGRVRVVYDWVMIVLAVVVAWTITLPEYTWVRTANLMIWAVFVVDYAVRVALSSDRRQFVRRNVPDLVAIIPFELFRLARLARLSRLIRLVRAGAVFWRATKDIRGVMGTNGLNYVLTFAVGTIAAGTVVIWMVEEAIGSFGDALWWSLVTATTVGYGDIAPIDPIGRIAAVVLMLVGIGTLGMITGSIATYFIHGRADDEVDDPELGHIRGRLDDWSSLSLEERRRIIAMLTAMTELESQPTRMDQTLR
jgi:voltage-gated potassium channel